ncbi:amidoligase family protein [Bengtsoniella intestinalis]|uniref:amidoligase family protein n=1 Tax=Bengtsoniella intestinalis TaxID=3073143 RepID=UPI00391F024C
MDLRTQDFGIEIEMTGLTRSEAADVVGDYFGTYPEYQGGPYYTYTVRDTQARKWKIVYDSSIVAQRVSNGRKVLAGDECKLELVSPICQYHDIETIQELVRKLRERGAFVNKSCGIHIHINAAPFEAKHLRNLVNIVAAKEDMIYRALQVDGQREEHYCRKIDTHFLDAINGKQPLTMEKLQSHWYNGHDGSHMHYHDSRYHCLNLHSVFQKGTIEFRAFNANLHAGKIKAYIQFCMGMTAQAHNQSYASPIKTKSTNDKYTFRVWLLRLGMIGDEFKTARKHLLGHLEGNIAWKDPAQAQAQKERLRAKREKELSAQAQKQEVPLDTPPPQEQAPAGQAPAFSMSMIM